MKPGAGLLIHRFTVRLRALSQVVSGIEGAKSRPAADKLPTAQVADDALAGGAA